MTTIQTPLISTVDANSPEAVKTLKSSTNAAAADSEILSSEIQSSLTGLLKSLAANAVISEKDPIKQLAASNPAIAFFITNLQESIFTAKATTPQGLLLKTQLDNGAITQEKFTSDVNAIVFTAEQAQSAVAADIGPQVQKLLISLSNIDELKKVEKWLSSNFNNSITEQQKTLEISFASDDQEKSIELLQSLAALAAAGQLKQDQIEGEFITQTLAKFTANNPDLAEEVLARITGEISTFFTLTVERFESLDNLVALAKNETFTSAVTLKAIFQQSRLKEKADETQGGTKQVRLEKTGSEADSVAQAALETKFKDVNLNFFQQIVANAKKIAEQNLRASAASLISLKPQPRIMSGARSVVKINGEIAALCTNVSYDITMDWTEIRGIDELIPNDLAPNSFSVKGSMTLYRVPNKSPIKDYLNQDMFSGILWPYSTIEIRDKRTDELIVLVKRAAITSRAESFAPGQLTATTLGFIGIGFRDEAVPQVLPDELPGASGGGMWDKFASGVKKFFS